MRKALVIGAVVVVGLFALVVAVAAVSMPSGSVATTNGTYSVELAMITVPIAKGPSTFMLEAPSGGASDMAGAYRSDAGRSYQHLSSLHQSQLAQLCPNGR